MDFQKNGFKSRIRALMDKNKQLDQQIENNDSAVKKSTLNDEKQDNNNELRKLRSQRYEIERVQEDIQYMKKSCLTLQKLGLIKSQYQFSQDFLRRTKHYLSMILCENRVPSIDSISCLVKKLMDVRADYENIDGKGSINRHLDNIITEGQQLIAKRLLHYW